MKLNIVYVLLAVVVFGWVMNRQRPDLVGRVFDGNGNPV